MVGRNQGLPQCLLGHGHDQAQAGSASHVKLSPVYSSSFRVPTDEERGMTTQFILAPVQKTANCQNDLRALTVGEKIEA